MRINWRVRIKNRMWCLAMVPAVLLLIQAVCALFGVTIDLSAYGEKVKDVINAVFVILTLLGITQDPTTKGLSDSDQAMKYEDPRR